MLNITNIRSNITPILSFLYRAHRKSQRLPPLPAHMDEVMIEQQPRGSYVLEVFHGYLAVGGN